MREHTGVLLDRAVPPPALVPSGAAQGTPVSDAEARRVLRDMAHRKTGTVPVEVVVSHVLTITVLADWAVKRAALEAVLRRRQSAEREPQKILARPRGGATLGSYRVASSKAGHAYEVQLRNHSPIDGSCSCPDYVRNSLGLCKHLWALVAAAHGRKTRRRESVSSPLLGWDPLRPLTGRGDPLDRIQWNVASFEVAPAQRRMLKRLFTDNGESRRTLKETHPDTPPLRLALVQELLRTVSPTGPLSSGKVPGILDPALQTLLSGEETRLRRLLKQEPVAAAVARFSKGLKHKLYPYQVEGVTRAVGQGRLLLADDMGLGKTAQAIATCHVLERAGSVGRGLLIVPAALKPQWLREWHSFTDIPASIVDGSAEERAALYRKTRAGFLIANYEQLHRDLPLMVAWEPDIIVLDEAQRIKNWQTKTAAAAKRLNPPFRLVLTGTPMENRLDELASVLDWVDDYALEPKWRLAPWHSTASDGGKEARGARNLATLRERLAPSFLRRRRQEVLTQLPSRTDTRVPVELTPQQQGEHDDLNQSISKLVNTGKRRPLTQPEFLRLMSLLTTQRMLCNGIALAHFEDAEARLRRTPATDAVIESLFTPKLRELRELVTQLVVNQGLRVVIFSQWRRMLSLADWATVGLLTSNGLRGVYFSGREGQKRRTQNIVDFHDDPATRVLFATDAGGVGLNLQHAASAVINLELPWNPAVLEQRIGRVYRNGQKRPVEIYNLVSETGIEARIAGLVADKQALFSGLFDGTTDEVKFEGGGSFMAKIEKLVEAKPEVAATSAEDDAGDVDVEDAVVAEADSDSGLLQAADSERLEPTATAPSAPPETTAATERLTPSIGGVDPPVATPSSGVAPEPVAAAAPDAALPASGLPSLDAVAFRGLLGQVRLQARADGGVTIDAPREAATTLAMLFGELARKLTELAAPPAS